MVLMADEPITVFYQADCDFCNTCRRFVEQRDISGFCVFKDIKESEYSLGKEKGFESIIVIDGEYTYTKFSACLSIGKQLKNPWPYIVWVLEIVPKSIGDWGYDWASNHRNLLINLTKG
jgi:predicted DCC family thiol-disulfide oxidoreductase YuxK